MAWAACVTGASCAHAQTRDYPVRPVRFIVPFPPGGGADVFGRVLGQKLTDKWGQQVVVDNRAGAGGIIGTESVAKAAPDGYTILHTSSAHSLLPAFNKLPYDAVRDFAPVSTATRTIGYVLAVHPSIPVKSLAELIAMAKAKPGYLTYGSTGIGSGFHLAGELFCAMAKVQMLHVPYRGGGTAAITDLVGGRVDLMWDSLAVVKPQLQAGRLHAVGVTGSRRAAALPNVATIAESGLPGYEIVGWHGIFAPAGTPREIVDRLSNTIGKILGAADIRELWNTQAMEIFPSTPEQFAARLRFDYERYGKLIKDAGIKLQ